MRVKSARSAAFNTLALLVSLTMFIPVYLVIVNAFKSQAEAASMGVKPPTTLHWDNFTTVIERPRYVFRT